LRRDLLPGHLHAIFVRYGTSVRLEARHIYHQASAKNGIDMKGVQNFLSMSPHIWVRPDRTSPGHPGNDTKNPNATPGQAARAPHRRRQWCSTRDPFDASWHAGETHPLSTKWYHHRTHQVSTCDMVASWLIFIVALLSLFAFA